MAIKADREETGPGNFKNLNIFNRFPAKLVQDLHGIRCNYFKE